MAVRPNALRRSKEVISVGISHRPSAVLLGALLPTVNWPFRVTFVGFVQAGLLATPTVAEED